MGRPDSSANAAAFGYPGSGKSASPAVFPSTKGGDDRGVRVARAGAGRDRSMASKGSGAQSLARICVDDLVIPQP